MLIFLLFLTSEILSTSAKVVDFHIRSKTLSRALSGDAEAPSNPDEESTSRDENSRKAGIALDLSGRFNVHISAPSYEMGFDDGLSPLFRFGKSRSIPSVQMGTDYDFNTVWYGATRLFTIFEFPRKEVPLQEPGLVRSAFQELIDSTCLRIITEKGLSRSGDYATEVRVETPAFIDGARPSFVSVRGDTASHRSTSIAIRLGIHKNLDMFLKATRKYKSEGETLSSFFTSRVPRTYGDRWIPVLRLDTRGHLTTQSEIGRNCNGRIVGGRLIISKQLDWASGLVFGGDDQDTKIRLELCSLNNARDKLTTLTIETSLEKPSDAQATLSTEYVLTS